MKEIEIGRIKFIFELGHKGGTNKRIFSAIRINKEYGENCETYDRFYIFSFLGLFLGLLVMDL